MVLASPRGHDAPTRGGYQHHLASIADDELEQMRNIREPPSELRRAMTCVHMLLMDGGAKRHASVKWPAVQATFTDEDFVERIRKRSPEDLTGNPHWLQRINDDYYSGANALKFQEVHSASKAGGALMRWGGSLVSTALKQRTHAEVKETRQKKLEDNQEATKRGKASHHVGTAVGAGHAPTRSEDHGRDRERTGVAERYTPSSPSPAGDQPKRSKKIGTEDILKHFKALDPRETGTISLSELWQILQRLLPNLSDQDVLELTSSSGAADVTYATFMNWLWFPQADAAGHDPELDQAAVKIQAIHRRRQARREVEAKRKEKMEKERRMKEKEAEAARKEAARNEADAKLSSSRRESVSKYKNTSKKGGKMLLAGLRDGTLDRVVDDIDTNDPNL